MLLFHCSLRCRRSSAYGEFCTWTVLKLPSPNPWWISSKILDL